MDLFCLIIREVKKLLKKNNTHQFAQFEDGRLFILHKRCTLVFLNILFCSDNYLTRQSLLPWGFAFLSEKTATLFHFHPPSSLSLSLSRSLTIKLPRLSLGMYFVFRHCNRIMDFHIRAAFPLKAPGAVALYSKWVAFFSSPSSFSLSRARALSLSLSLLYAGHFWSRWLLNASGAAYF